MLLGFVKLYYKKQEQINKNFTRRKTSTLLAVIRYNLQLY